VCLPQLISPCTIKSRSSLLAPAYPGGPEKRAIKQLCVCACACVRVCVCNIAQYIKSAAVEIKFVLYQQ